MTMDVCMFPDLALLIIVTMLHPWKKVIKGIHTVKILTIQLSCVTGCSCRMLLVVYRQSILRMCDESSIMDNTAMRNICRQYSTNLYSSQIMSPRIYAFLSRVDLIERVVQLIQGIAALLLGYIRVDKFVHKVWPTAMIT